MDSDGDGICDESEIPGCMDEEACNFLEDATDEDESCVYIETDLAYTIYQLSPTSDEVVAGETVTIWVPAQENITFECEVLNPEMIMIFGPEEGNEWEFSFPEIAGVGRIYVSALHSAGEDCETTELREITVVLPLPDNVETLALLERGLVIFPNPVEDVLNVQIDALVSQENSRKGKWSVQILNLTGQMVHSQQAASRMILPVADYAEGMYFLQLAYPSGTITRRFVVNRME